MFSNILNHLVIAINQKLWNAKDALETEEKARETAMLQGSIIGWRKLLDLLQNHFGLNIPLLVENDGDAPILESIGTAEIKRLHAEMENIIKSAGWKELVIKVAENKEALKESLLATADSARDLYLAQAQQEGIAAYEALFAALSVEYQCRSEELDFDAVPYEEPAEENQERPALPGQLALPAPKKPRKGKKQK
jgi:hypothetical protein